MNDNPKMGLISVDNNDQFYYRQLLSPYEEIDVEIFSTIHQFRNDCQGKKYTGLMIDLKTLIESSMADKEFYNSLCHGFLILQIDRGEEDCQFHCLIEGSNSTDLQGTRLLEYYIQKKCYHSIPRGIRMFSRKIVYFNAFLYLNKNDSPIKTNLWDISLGGCFVISAKEKFCGDLVWISINELKDKSPICGEIKWKKSWGTNSNKLPGYGVSFVDLSDSQRQDIDRIISFQ